MKLEHLWFPDEWLGTTDLTTRSQSQPQVQQKRDRVKRASQHIGMLAAWGSGDPSLSPGRSKLNKTCLNQVSILRCLVCSLTQMVFDCKTYNNIYKIILQIRDNWVIVFS